MVLCRTDATLLSLLQTKAAYVLFYQRREGPAPTQPSASSGAACDGVDDHMDTN